MQRSARRLGAAAIVVAFLVAAALKAAAEQTPADGALAVLRQHCGDCHGSADPEQGLDLSSAASLLAGSKTGAVVVPGEAANSLLVQVLAADADPHMPPEGQLAADEIALITAWVAGLDSGTPVGRARITPEDREHWSFQPVVRPKVPGVLDASWTRTAVDRFVLAGLEGHDLRPSDEAPRATLLRRLSFDLIGLPPTPEEIAAFEGDERPDAYERLVDRLLASPHYGERWGRHWLDLARYADSSGFHEDHDRPAAWRYRDYVVDSFNADKPYGRFVREQIAGDELPDATLESWIATGFGRNGPSNETNMGKGAAIEQYRLDQLDGIVSTTASTFLGLTLGCARCHDHRFDPLSQRDYYAFLACFDGATYQRVLLAGFDPAAPALQPFQPKRLEQPFAEVLTDRGNEVRTTHLLWRGDPRNEGPVVEPGVPELLAAAVPFEPIASTDSQSHVLGRRAGLAAWIAGDENPLVWRVMANRVWQHHFGVALVGTPGNFGLQGERPTHPELLDWLADELRRSGGSLKSLHRAIVTSAAYRQSSATDHWAAVDPENRLLWRANRRRLEAEPMRDAILAVSGQLNTAMGGPGVKPHIRPDLLVASQRNKWPVVKREGPEHWRRSVYVYVKRQLQYPMLELFDSPSTTHSCDLRRESLVPTQSLLLMNDEFVREQAAALADRVGREVGEDDRERIVRAFELALGRGPDDRRTGEATVFLARQRDRLISEGIDPAAARREAFADLCHVLFNLSEFLYVE